MLKGLRGGPSLGSDARADRGRGGILVWYALQWELSQLWVILGLVGFASTFVTGLFFIGPEAGRLAKLFDERPLTDTEIQRRIARISSISRVDQLVLVLVIADMVLKPGV